MDGEQSQWQLNLAVTELNLDINGNFPRPLAFELEAQHQHSQTIESKTPDHAKGISFTECDDVTAAQYDRQQLQTYNHVDDAAAGTVFFLRLAEPVGEHAIFRDAVQHAVGADDGSIDSAGKDQEPTDHYERLEEQPE